MKKLFLIICFLLMSVNCFAGAGVMGVLANEDDGGSSSYFDITFYYDMETYYSNKPVLEATTKTLTLSTAYKLAGSYSATYNSANTDKIVFTNTADAIFDRTSARSGIWIRTGATITDNDMYFMAYYDASNWIGLRNLDTTGLDIRFIGNGSVSNTYISGVISPSTAYYVEVSLSGATVNIYINGTLQSVSRSGTPAAMSATPANGIIIVGPNTTATPVGAYMDQLIISDSTSRDINAIKTVTNFD